MIKQEKKYYFEEAPIASAIANFALPMMLSMMVSVVYNLVDTFYIGLLGDYTLVAAVSLSTPIFFVFMGIGNVFGIGGGTYISRLLGMKDEAGVKKASSFVFYGSIVSGLVLSAFGLIFIEPILRILGVSVMTVGPTREYTLIMLFGGIFKVLSFSLTQVIRAEGSPREAMMGNILGTLINIVLDPVFLFVFRWGVAGIAVATLISEIFSTLFYVCFIWKKSTLLSLKISDFVLEKRIINEVFKIGFPTFLLSLVLIMTNLLQNVYAAGFSDVYVAVFAIIFKLSLIPILLCRGLTLGVQPLIAYNYARKNFQRTREVLKKAFLYGNIFCVLVFLTAYLFAPLFLNLFSHNAQIVDLGTPMFKISALSFLTYPLIFLSTSVFQSMGKAIPSLLMSMSQGVFFAPLVVFASRAAGVFGFAWALPLSNICSAVMGAAIYMAYRKKIWA